MTGSLRSIALFTIAAAFVGCGGGDNDSGVLKVSGGEPDPASVMAEENKKKPVDKNDPTFEKMAGPDRPNTARNPGVTSGGSAGTAILD